MCGIAGLAMRHAAAADTGLLDRMTDVLAHRGPDGRGVYVDGPVGLGHRRLSIIDLNTGSQPMDAVDGDFWITYNGEVYNYTELRAELSALGHRFRTTSDTEVVLQAYVAWGPDSLRRLRGMFAFAIWDRPRRRLLLARDRVGIKPLMYACDEQGLRFASEIKAILEDRDVPRDLDWDALGDYFVHHYIPAPRTIFRAIRKLPPASYLLWSVDAGDPVIHRYWDLPFTVGAAASETERIDRLRDVLDDSVKAHMVSDVPVGAFLSGGMDSSTVVASMARVSPGRVKTFSIGFDDESFDELAYARQVAQRYGTDHVEMIVKPDVVEVLPRLAWQLDEPFADSSAVPTYCVSRITRDHVTVALSGDGGDESFAGYGRYAVAAGLHERVDRSALRMLKPLLRTLARPLRGARGAGFLRLLGDDPLTRYHRLVTYSALGGVDAILTSEAARALASTDRLSVFRRLAASAGTDEYLSQLQYIDIHHYLPDDILAKVDRTSMLVSLETRVPLLDHVVMEHAASLPPALKLRDGSGKYILKEAMRDRLPAAILSRRKMGFGVPLASWFRKELRELAHDVLLDGTARQRGIVDDVTVRRILHGHLDGTRDYSAVLWALVSFELWCRTWWQR